MVAFTMKDSPSLWTGHAVAWEAKVFAFKRSEMCQKFFREIGISGMGICWLTGVCYEALELRASFVIVRVTVSLQWSAAAIEWCEYVNIISLS